MTTKCDICDGPAHSAHQAHQFKPGVVKRGVNNPPLVLTDGVNRYTIAGVNSCGVNRCRDRHRPGYMRDYMARRRHA